MLLRAQGELEEALASYFRARDIQRRLTLAYPHVTQYQDELATTCNNLGNLHNQRQKPREAIASFREAQDTLRKLAKAHPGIPEHQADLARCCSNLGLALRGG